MLRDSISDPGGGLPHSIGILSNSGGDLLMKRLHVVAAVAAVLFGAIQPARPVGHVRF